MSQMPFSFGSTEAANGSSAPASAMDVSFDAASPSEVRLDNTADDTDHEKEDGVLGYQGWTARRLVVACHRIFLSTGQADPVAVSLEHRGVIYWSLCNMDADAGHSSGSAGVDSDQLRQQEDTFHDGLTDFYHVWTLAEAFLLDYMPLPAAPLLRWLKMYCQSNEDEDDRYEIDEAEAAALEGNDENTAIAEVTPAYWKAVRSLVVSAMPRRAAAMLRQHPEGRDNTVEVGALARQLEKMPLLAPQRQAVAEDTGGDGEGNGGNKEGGMQLDREAFFGTWARWQRACKAAASSFGVFTNTGDGSGRGTGGSGGRGGKEKRQLRWLWGTLCGERDCLEEGTQSWAGLLAAVLAFERPDVRKEEVATLMRECAMRYPPLAAEEFLLNVISDASVGAVDATLRFAQDHGDTLALSACAAHLVDLLKRAKLPSVTSAQRSWYFRRLANRLQAMPYGGWEIAAAYVGGAAGHSTRAPSRLGQEDTDEQDEQERLLQEMAKTVRPGSERAAHELVEWCRANSFGNEAIAMVCQARGAAWIAKTGFSSEAMGIEAEEGGTPSSVPGACGKAAYWLAKGGGVIQLERLCAEVSESLMVEVPYAGAHNVDSDDGCSEPASKAAVAEAEGVLAAIPPGITGPELSFLQRYKEIADLLMTEARAGSQRHPEENEHIESSASPHVRAAAVLAVDLLAPRVRAQDDGSGGRFAPPPRTWAHLLRLALPALRGSVALVAARGRGGGRGSDDDLDKNDVTTKLQVHALLAKMQALMASEHRVGSGTRVSVYGDSCRGGTLASAPKPYGFLRGKEEVLEIRKALADCLAGAMMVQNARDASEGAKGRAAANAREPGRNRPHADVLIAPRVFVGP